ncbi:hypothetical protein D515_02342 [Grimontia indica]|uniref:Uncharacterized protein n=2 Tax=Grimontia indica TaxID=1056512 RepID=R1IU14_9GAMM|nr:hypothetical protein D515_02342 [Grimontia indica]
MTMKKLMIAAAIGLTAFIIYSEANREPRERINYAQALPEAPAFEVSSNFDGQWEGKRIDISGDNICLETRILGSIEEGKVSLRLMYNNTLLKGWIADDGKLELYSNNERWGYDFKGTAQNGQIDGEWKVSNAPCRGSWKVVKV